jgi:hypothetical protein
MGNKAGIAANHVPQPRADFFIPFFLRLLCLFAAIPVAIFASFGGYY